MTYHKRKPSLLPAPLVIKREVRIIDGKSRPVETFRGKVVRVFDDKHNIIEDRSDKFAKLPDFPGVPYIKPKTKKPKVKKIIEEDINNLGNNKDTESIAEEIGLQVIPKEEASYRKPDYKQFTTCPECKSRELDALLYLENATRYKCKGCGNIFASPKSQEILPTSGVVKSPEIKVNEVTAKSIPNSDVEIKVNEVTDAAKSPGIPTSDVSDIAKSSKITTSDVSVSKLAPKSQKIPTSDIKSPEIKANKATEIPTSDVTNAKSPEIPTSDVADVAKSPEIPTSDVADVAKSPEIPTSDVADAKLEIKVNESPEIPTSDVTDITKTLETKAPTSDAVTPEIIKSQTDEVLEVNKSPDIPIPNPTDQDFTPKKKFLKPTVKKEAKEVPIPGIKMPISKPVKIGSFNMTKDQPKTDQPKTDQPKTDVIKTEQGKENKIEKIMEAKKMTDEEEALMQERKFEEWLKRHKFNESMQKMVETTEENKGKISDISDEMLDIRHEIGSVEERLDNIKENLNSSIGEVKKPITETLGELCNGVNCIKDDVKKYQDSQSELDKKLENRFSELKDRVHNLEEPTFVCDNCGQDGIRALSSYCPNCGAPIHEWFDETGQPVRGWIPHWKRTNMKQVA